MSIVSVEEKRESPSGSKNYDGNREYTRTFRVTTDDKDDGPITVWDATTLPQVGERYDVGNEEDAWAYVTSIEPKRLEDNPKLWDVTVSYSTPVGSNEDPDDDNPDPNQIEPESVSFTFAQYVKTAEKGQRIVGGAGSGWGAITNTAHVPFTDPPVEIDDARGILRISRSITEFDVAEADAVMNTVNGQEFSFTWRGLKLKQPKHTVKLSALSANLHYRAEQYYWRVEYEFHLSDWYVYLMDVGMAATDIPNDDGEEWEPTDISPLGHANLKTIQDVDGIPSAEPVLLDGQGRPLHVNTFATNAVFLQYQVYKEVNFADYDLMEDLPRNTVQVLTR